MSTDKVIAQLNERMGIAGAVRFEAGEGGLTRAVLTCDGAEAHVYRHGAHVTHFEPAGADPVLFVSEGSRFEEGKPIRGGVPVCFPWFADNVPKSVPNAPAHGIARNSNWKLRSVEQFDDGAVQVVLVLKWSPRALALWPHKFTMTHTVTLRPAALTMALWVKHLGLPDSDPFTFEAALHTYLRIGDIHRTTVLGLENTEYVDKTGGGRRKTQGDEPIAFTQETDRVYLDTTSTCIADDPAAGRRIAVEKAGSSTTVVWNPWTAKAARMTDFGDDEWPHMLCIETANVGEQAVTLRSEQSHTMTATLRVD